MTSFRCYIMVDLKSCMNHMCFSCVMDIMVSEGDGSIIRIICMYLSEDTGESCSMIAILVCSRLDFRLEACRLRARFDKHKNELDMRKCKELLRLGEEELVATQALFPFICKLFLFILRNSDIEYC